jgi:HEAT repeat protein
MSEPLCRRLVEGAGLERLTRQASSQTVSASRRITALRALTVGGSLRAVELLERALECDDEQVVTAAIALLGLVRDRRAAVILMQALRACAHRAPKAAASLDALPLDAFDVVVPLAADESPCNRAWAAVLMRRYGASAEVQRRLAALAGDADPHVRHTALGVLGDVGGQVALDAVQRRLTDSVGMVRARAARALASMGATESAWRIAVLLGDREWTVRSAACDALTSLGPAAALALGPAVASDDPFVRDSAAAVMRRLSGADPGGPGVSGLEWRVDDLAADGLADVDEAIA